MQYILMKDWKMMKNFIIIREQESKYGFKNKITAEEVNKLRLMRFEGSIVVVDHVSKVAPAVSYLKKSNILGFDTETRPSFKKGKNNKVALLQLANAGRAYIFQLMKTGMPDTLTDLLSDENILKAGVAIHDDIKALKALSQFVPGGFIDLQNVVGNYGIENKGLKKLAGIVLNGRISKSQRLTNWENDILDEAQQIYAATDAWVCYEIYKKLNSLNA